MQFVTCTRAAHGQAILDILNDAITTSTALYDYHPRALDSMDDWFAIKAARGFPVVGITADSGALLGFATYGTFRAWPAYKYSVEHSLYIHKDHRAAGLGSMLMRELVAVARTQQYHMMVGGIDVDNAASIALHRKFGFVHAGTIREAAFKFGRWLDLGWYQLILDTPTQPVDG